jgi:ankyrin repeat protein
MAGQRLAWKGGSRMRAKATSRSLVGVVSLLLSVVSAAGAAEDLQLVEAAKRQDFTAVQALVREGADVNTTAADGTTALHWAVHWDDLATAELLIQTEANVNATNDLGVMPLLLACNNGITAMIDLLLKAGADPNTGPAERETPVMAAARTGNADAMKLLLAYGGDVNAKESSRGQTALMWAVAQQHPEIVRVLVEGGAHIHARTRETAAPTSETWQQRASRQGRRRPGGVRGLTALLFAVRVGDGESARILLDAGANVADTANDGMSALVLATVRGHSAVVTLLLERGANPNADGAGYTALHWASGSWESELTTTAITTDREGTEWYTVAGLKEHKLEVVTALLAHGADPNARLTKTPARAGSSRNAALPELEGATPYLLAAMAGDTQVMRTLAAAGADVGLRTKAEGTPLMAAAGLGRVPGEVTVPESDTLAAAKLAVKFGADVDPSDAVGNTALHYAAFLRRDSIIQFLADQGATLDVKNKYDETPLWAAELVIQFSGGGTFQVRRSSTSELLRTLGAQTIAPLYDYARPTEWPDIPRSASGQVIRQEQPQETPRNSSPEEPQQETPRDRQ